MPLNQDGLRRRENGIPVFRYRMKMRIGESNTWELQIGNIAREARALKDGTLPPKWGRGGSIKRREWERPSCIFQRHR
jgi:hypothetical protein